MTEEIRKLPTTFRKHGYDFELVEREEKKAIYAQSYEGRILAFEVIKIRVRPPQTNVFLGREDPAREVYPTSEQWGRQGWTICEKDKAMEKYNSL